MVSIDEIIGGYCDGITLGEIAEREENEILAIFNEEDLEAMTC